MAQGTQPGGCLQNGRPKYTGINKHRAKAPGIKNSEVAGGGSKPKEAVSGHPRRGEISQVNTINRYMQDNGRSTSTRGVRRSAGAGAVRQRTGRGTGAAGPG